MLAIVSSRLQGWKRAKKLWSFDCWRMLATREAGGGSGIRTRDTVSRIHALQACAFNHSATPPRRLFRGAAEGNEGAPDAQSGACQANKLSLTRRGDGGRAIYDFRSGPARAMTCISPSAPAIA